MELLIKDLIRKIAEKRNKELELIEQYKKNNIKTTVFISAGKIIEMDNLMKDLIELLQYNSKTV